MDQPWRARAGWPLLGLGLGLLVGCRSPSRPVELPAATGTPVPSQLRSLCIYNVHHAAAPVDRSVVAWWGADGRQCAEIVLDGEAQTECPAAAPSSLVQLEAAPRHGPALASLRAHADEDPCPEDGTDFGWCEYDKGAPGTALHYVGESWEEVVLRLRPGQPPTRRIWDCDAH